MKRSTAVLSVAVVVVGVFVVRQTTGLFGGNGRSDADVVLTTVGTVCHADISNDLGGAWKNKVYWHITNRCADQQYVSFLDYRERLGGGGLGPSEHVVDPDPANSPVVPPGNTTAVTVDAKIDKFNFNLLFRDKTFKYKICVGPAANPTTNCTDPDLDVWPF